MATPLTEVFTLVNGVGVGFQTTDLDG